MADSKRTASPRSLRVSRRTHSVEPSPPCCARSGKTPPTSWINSGTRTPKLALRIYAQAMAMSEEDRLALRALVDGPHWALLGTNGVSEDSASESEDADSALESR
jgi:hypothetical protein